MNFYYFSRLLEVLLICAIKRSLFLDFVYLLEYSECLANKSYLKHCEHYALLNEVFFIVLFFKGILDQRWLHKLLLAIVASDFFNAFCVVGFRYRGAVFVLLKLLFQLMLFLWCLEIVSLYETMMKLLKLSFFYLRVYRALTIVSLFETTIFKKWWNYSQMLFLWCF